MHFAVVAFGNVIYSVQYVVSDCVEVSVDVGKYQFGHGIGKLHFVDVDNLVSFVMIVFDGREVFCNSALCRPFI